MKLTTFLLLSACLQVSAKGHAQNITLSTKGASLETVLDRIREQSGYHLVYLKEWMAGTQKVSVELKDVPLQEALDLCFQGQPLSYTIIERTIVVKLGKKPAVEPAADGEARDTLITVYLRVTDEDNRPLPGVIAYVKGTQRGIVAEEDGTVTIHAIDKHAILVFSSINMERQEVNINGRSTILVRLKKRTTELAEVAVELNTGYQKLSKERATGSFAKPDMKVFAERSSTMDLIERLEGQVPGLTIVHDGNGPINRNGNGNGNSTSLIRGTSSVALPPDPLYVVNGVVATDFSAVNLDDIADITVLKDAAAAAVWGARAANGVIVVTTKSGQRDQKIRVGYSGWVNFAGKPDLNYNPGLNSKQFIQAAKETFDPEYYDWGSLYDDFVAPHEVILYNQYNGLITAAQANASLDSLASINNLRQIKDLWFRNAITTNHTVSVSGGSGIYNFYSSFNYQGMQSPTPGVKNNEYRFNLGQDFNPSRNIRLSLNSSLSDAVRSSKRPISIGNRFLPYQLFKDANGKSISMPYLQGISEDERKEYEDASGVGLDYNPLDEMNSGHTDANNLSIDITANANIKIWKGISFLGTYGYLTSPGSGTDYDDISELNMRQDLVSLTIPGSAGSAPQYLIPDYGGRFQTFSNNQQNWTVRNQLLYAYSGREGKDQLNLQAGQEASDQHSHSYSHEVMGYDEKLQTFAYLDYNTLQEGVPNTVTGYGYLSSSPFNAYDERSRFTSYFALASYTLDRKYSLDASWRTDKSNLFGSDISSQNKPVWSFGAKWDLGKEQFMKPAGWLNDLAVRATYGITGNSPNVGGASTYDILSQEHPYSYTLVAGRAYAISENGNSRLDWESTHTLNLGLDLSLLHGRLSGAIDYYHKNTTSLLGSVPVNPFVGTDGSTTGNIGNLTNTGIEFSLSSINIKTKDFTWTTKAVFSYNKNKLVSYSKQQSYSLDAEEVTGDEETPYVGYSLNPLFAYRYAGLDNVGDPRIRLANGKITKEPEVATITDLAYEGSVIPPIGGGLSNNFQYKQLALSLNMVYYLGGVMRRPNVNNFYSGRLTADRGFSGNVAEEFANRWKKAGDEATTNIPSYVSDEDYNYDERNTDYYTKGDLNVISSSYLRLTDATLSYSLKPALLRLLGVQGLSLRVQAGNFLLWKNNKYGIDPTVYNGVPSSKHNYTIGANINF